MFNNMYFDLYFTDAMKGFQDPSRTVLFTGDRWWLCQGCHELQRHTRLGDSGP